MVVKLWSGEIINQVQFESSVISYGSKTVSNCLDGLVKFESSVISYGSKT